MKEAFSIRNYMRPGLKPQFCPGCGCLRVSIAFLKAVYESGHHNLRKFCFVSGIGCSSLIPLYYLADAIHTLHGRSIPVATSIKLLRRELHVVVFGGDGDLVGIGMGHLVHAARRNVDILVIMVNNMVYGMTGGQVAPTTPKGVRTTTTPYGNFEPPIDAVRLVVAAGANYAARWTATHLDEFKDSCKKALTMDGFRFIEIVSPCPSNYGRRVGFESASEMLKWLKDISISVSQAQAMSEVELEEKIVIGEFVERKRPGFVESIYTLLKEVSRRDA